MLTLQPSLERTTILTLADERLWRDLVDEMPIPDLAFTPRFSRVYERKGDGVAECFVYETGAGRVIYPYIRRSLRGLPFVTSDLANHCDIWTPYCYGGFLHDAEPRRAPELLGGFRRAFQVYARETRIVSEFVRFHPLLRNHVGAAPYFDHWTLHRDNVVVDLREEPDVLYAGCRKSYRHCIRKARQAGLELRIETCRDGHEQFAELYRQTMQRHNQDGYLNLDAHYFEILFRELADDIELVSVCYRGGAVARAVFLRCGDYLDYFLCGSDVDSFALFPNHFLLWQMVLRAKAQGLRLLHLGGGRDSLYFFKRGFSAQTVPFYIGAKVHLPEPYAVLAARRAAAQPPLTDVARLFFPAHRAGYE